MRRREKYLNGSYKYGDKQQWVPQNKANSSTTLWTIRLWRTLFRSSPYFLFLIPNRRL